MFSLIKKIFIKTLLISDDVSFLYNREICIYNLEKNYEF